MKKIAIFPGSFDPIHVGHLNIIKRASKLFDQLIVVVSINVDKKDQSDLNKREKQVIKKVKKLKLKNVSVAVNDELTIDFAKKVKAKYIVRSFRSSSDVEYEMDIARAHHYLDKTIETVLFIADKDLRKKSSTDIRKVKEKIKKIKSKK